MNSIPAYYEDTYRFSDTEMVEEIGQDEKGYFLVLNKSIFYPQGGGQPSDQGHLIFNDKEIPIHSARLVNGKIHHYTHAEHPEIVGHSVILHINPDIRILHAKLHTAGHLIGNVVEHLLQDCKAVKGHHFPGECYVEFASKKNKQALDLNLIQQEIDNLIDQNLQIKKQIVSAKQLETICPNLPYAIPLGESIRLIKIGSFAYQPCGGTHLNTLSELKGLQLTKHKIKDNKIKVYYTIN